LGTRRGREPGVVLYETEHVVTKHRITIGQKVDRSLLLVAWEQSRQVLMIKINVFGHVEDEKHRLEPNDDVLLAALKFMTPIVDKFAKDELKASELIQARNDKMKELKLGKVSMKRPAGQALRKETKKQKEQTNSGIEAEEAKTVQRECAPTSGACGTGDATAEEADPELSEVDAADDGEFLPAPPAMDTLGVLETWMNM
jgi:hypothetical protein